MHDCLPCSLTERIVKLVAVVFAQVVSNEGLAAVFVYPLQHLLGLSAVRCSCHTFRQAYLIPSGIPKSRKQRKELLWYCGSCVVLEDDGIECRGIRNLRSQVRRADSDSAMIRTHLSLIAHQTLRYCVDLGR